MSKIVRILLAVAFLIFIGGVVWSFVLIDQKNKEIKTTNTTNTSQTTITTSTNTTQPSTTPTPAPNPAQGVVAKPTATKKAAPKNRLPVTYFYYYEKTSSSASAWAHSGVNADGSTYAEAYAQ